MADLGEDVDAVVRRVDPDRWLASRFIDDPRARADVIAVYALEHELARALSVASQPMMIDIRLTWWADAIGEIYAGQAARRHPVVLALAGAIERRGLPQAAFDSLLDAYFAEPLDKARAAEATMRLGTAVLGAPDAQVSAAARAWASHDPVTLAEANRQIGGLSAKAFPAVAYAALARTGSGELARRLRLMWTVIRGRL